MTDKGGTSMTRRSTSRKRQAFTLLELMIVLVILVLLAAVAGRRLLRTQKKAEINIAKTQISQLESALEDYVFDVRSYPSSEDGLQALVEAPSDDKVADKWDGPYLEDTTLPLDPWGNPYEYEYPPTKNAEKPDIWSIGPDGEPDTSDDIGNWPAGAGDERAGESTTGDRSGKDRASDTRERVPARKSTGTGGGASDRGSSRTGTGTGAGTGRPK